jgi:exosortase
MSETLATSIPDTRVNETRLSRWRDLGIHCYVKIGIIAVLFYLVYYLEINRIVYKWKDPSWSHGFLIPLFSLYFLHQVKDEILNQKFKSNYLGLFFLICGLAFYPFNIIQLRFGYLSPLSMIATLGAVILFLGGWKLVKYTWLPVAFLVFAVPLPDRYYRGITIPMRIWAASIASSMLNLVKDLHATASGVVIDIFYKGVHMEPPLDVAEACSGMRLLMAFVALGVAMAYLHKRPVWQRLVLLASTVPIAILCNIVRVTITGFIHVLIGPKYSQGVYHDTLGMCMLPLAFGLYGALAWFLSNVFVEEKLLQPEKKEVIIRRREDKQV